ncbi:hypothetical protein L1049_015480 [Liquidambar formosana]|uniref:Ribosome biogenesis protein slx9-like n=1 Tax=Liquidambar formosana TaxID=63359 RepID=A0AAP0S3Q7_LIQFO
MGLSSLRSESSKKSERKFEKKLQFYSKVRETVASLSAKKTISKKKKLRSRQKKLKVYDLSTLSEFLPEFKAQQQPTPATELKLNSKTRKKLVAKEGKQLRTVLNHPTFKLDPLAAIHQHLASTQPVTVENREKKLSKNRKKKVKGKKSKTSPGPQSMDM